MHHAGAFLDPTIESAEKSSQLVSLKNSQSSEEKKKHMRIMAGVGLLLCLNICTAMKA